MAIEWLKRLFGGEVQDVTSQAQHIEKRGTGAMSGYRRIENLDEVLARSAGRKIVIFKHSTACGVSRGARGEVDSFVESHPEVETYLVVIQEQRRLSNEIARKLGVKHESPQLIVVENGRAVALWNHWEIRKEEISKSVMGG